MSSNLCRLASLALFAWVSVRLAAASEPTLSPPPITAEQLQKAVTQMKLDLGGTMDLEKLLGGKQPDLSRLREMLQSNPALRKQIFDHPESLPIDPKVLKSIVEKLPKDVKIPPDFKFPPGIKLPPDMKLPPGIKLPTPMPPSVDRKLPSAPPPRIDEPEATPPETSPPQRFDEYLPRGRSPTAEDLVRERRAMTLAKSWERILGPLDDNPALRKALMEMVLAGEELKGPDGTDLWKFLEQNAGQSGDDFGDFLKGLDSFGGDWKLPKLDLSGLNFGDWKWNWGSNTGPSHGGSSTPSAPSGGSINLAWLGDSWLPVILFVVVLVAVLLVWRFWYDRGEPQSRAFQPPPGLGPWPLDPRTLASRGDVVKAFEYLTVLRCGEDSRAWNHLTIALTLASQTSDAASASQVARLYAQARYAPAADEFSPADLDAARRHICRLAGVRTA